MNSKGRIISNHNQTVRKITVNHNQTLVAKPGRIIMNHNQTLVRQ